MNEKNKEQKDECKLEIKKFRRRKQDEQVICTIKKDSNHISYQDLVIQKKRAKRLLKHRSLD